jgi:plastocyanin domain-containing protein
MSLVRAGFVALSLLAAACKPKAPPAPPPAPAAAPAAVSPRVEVAVTDEGFVPSRIPAKAGAPLTLVITRKTDKTCAREILFAGQEGKTELPLDKAVEVVYTPKAVGEIKFGCAMGMMVGGVLAVSD